MSTRNARALVSTVVTIGLVVSITFAPPVAAPGDAAPSVLPAAAPTPTVPLPAGGPAAMVFSPSGHRLYTADFWSDTVSVINPATNAVLSTIDVGYRPNSIALSPDGTTLVTGHLEERGITVVTIATGATRWVYLSSRVDDVLFSSDGRSLFFTAAAYWIGVLTVPGYTEGRYIEMRDEMSGLFRQPGTDWIWTGESDPSPFSIWRFNERTRATEGMATSGYTGGSFGFPAGNERVFGTLNPGNGAGFVNDLSKPGADNWRRMPGVANYVANDWVTTLDRSVLLGRTVGPNLLVVDPLSERVVDEIVIGAPQTAIAVRPGVGDVWLGLDGGILRIEAPTLPIAQAGSGGTVRVERIFGADRFSTAVEISEAAFPEGTPADTVFIASGLGFADALAAAPAAIVRNGPLLLTGRVLPAVVRDELVRLAPPAVVLVGGTGVVTSEVEAAVRAALPSAEIIRLSGANRYETGRAVVMDTWPGAVQHVVMTTGRDFPDALSAAPLAGSTGSPLLLVDGLTRGYPTQFDAIDPATRTVLNSLRPTNRTVVGGAGVVTNDLLTAFTLNSYSGARDKRLWGSDRYRTNQHVNGVGYASADTVYLASGVNFPDALAGSVLAGRGSDPLFLVRSTCVPRNVLVAIERLGAESVVLIGGTGAMSPAVAALTPCA